LSGVVLPGRLVMAAHPTAHRKGTSMGNDAPTPLTDFDDNIEKRKREYWNKLIAANDPDAVEKHDAFCAELDQIANELRASTDRIDRAVELTRDTMMNVIIAQHQGDHDEVARLVLEFEAKMKAMPPSEG